MLSKLNIGLYAYTLCKKSQIPHENCFYPSMSLYLALCIVCTYSCLSTFFLGDDDLLWVILFFHGCPVVPYLVSVPLIDDG